MKVVNVAMTQVHDQLVVTMSAEDGSSETLTLGPESDEADLIEAFKKFGDDVLFEWNQTSLV